MFPDFLGSQMDICVNCHCGDNATTDTFCSYICGKISDHDLAWRSKLPGRHTWAGLFMGLNSAPRIAAWCAAVNDICKALRAA